MLVLIAQKKFNLFFIFRVHLNFNSLSDSTVEDIPKVIVILHGSDTEKTIG